MRLLAYALCVSASLASAQSPTEVFSKAPPEVEKVLRSRVDKFFELYAAGKFRAAEELVHPDSKDYFYNAAKTPLLSYDTSGIKYSDQFTKAVVFTTVEMDWRSPRLGKMRVRPLMNTYWKLDQGQWWWYVDQKNTWNTPFGTMTKTDDPPRDMASMRRMGSIAELIDQIQIGNKDITLSAYQPSEATGTITNHMPGEVEIKLDEIILPKGLTVTLSKTKLARDETATVTFKYNPPDRWNKPELEVPVILVQTGYPYRFTVRFSPDPEVQKMLQGR